MRIIYSIKKISVLYFLLLCLNWYGASAHVRDTTYLESPVTITTETGELAGTLTLPDRAGGSIALIIAGSGPTDRNGNSFATQNNAYQMLARELANKGISSVRYDKRGIGGSAKAMKKEIDLRFDDYINDAVAWIEWLKKDKRFSSITVIGHSEGSLLGMAAAAKTSVSKYVSIAGTGLPIDEVLKTQLKAGNPEMYDLSLPVLDSLKQGLTVKNIDRKIMMLFRPSVQPFMISWIKYDPRVEIKKLKIPVLIIQGTNDMQVSVDNANNLKAALPAAQLVLIENMNHVLKIIVGDRVANEATYHEPLRPLAPTLSETIVKFISSS